MNKANSILEVCEKPEDSSDEYSISTRKNILVVDDNKQNRKILCKILNSCGFNVVEAENGEIALELLNDRRKPVSLVLLDLFMPIMDGYSVLKAMNDTGIIASVPVIVTTDNENEEIRCLENGASDFIKKPYSAELVQHRVKSLLRLWDNAALINRLETDHLTGVLSKESFYRRAQEMLDEYPKDIFYITYTDIDDFKMINARYGIEAGDELLRYLAEKFKANIDKRGICGRLGPDNFAVLLKSESVYDKKRIIQFCEEELTDAPVKGFQIKFGVYTVTDRGIPVHDMCDRAKMAVLSIKHRYGVYFVAYDESLRIKAIKDHQLADRMDEALEKKEFVVYFQPKHYTESGAVAGAEALVRWNHPELGFLSPVDFIPLFESSGFVSKLDSYMLNQVCGVLREWIDEGIKPIPISVNISRADFEVENLPELIEKIVDAFNLDHELIHLEITESAYTDHPQKIISTLTALQDMGFLIEMDDFGSGYSSLNMLSELPINILKLDMRFIQSGKRHAIGSKQNILSFIISLSKWLQFPTVAEGVETKEEFELLRTMGCDLIQGYYFAKPMPVSDFKEYLLANPETKAEGRSIVAACEEDCEEDCEEKKLVMVVEDVDSNRQAMVELLKPYYRVVQAENGKIACKYLARHREEIDCILLDLLMPVMDGFQMLEVMRTNGSINEIPIIISTETGSDNELRALHLGADGFVAKPYNPEILLHNVKKAVKEKQFWKIKKEFEREKEEFYAQKAKAEQ